MKKIKTTAKLQVKQTTPSSGVSETRAIVTFSQTVGGGVEPAVESDEVCTIPRERRLNAGQATGQGHTGSEGGSNRYGPGTLPGPLAEEGGFEPPIGTFVPYSGLANRRLQPLGHPSVGCGVWGWVPENRKRYFSTKLAFGNALRPIAPQNRETWRRERDSNPRWACAHNGFQDRRFQPLSHPSARAPYHYGEGPRALSSEACRAASRFRVLDSRTNR